MRVLDRLRLALGVAGRDHEEVRVADDVAHVEHDHVARLLVERDARDAARQRLRRQRSPPPALIGRAPPARSGRRPRSGTRNRYGRPSATRAAHLGRGHVDPRHRRTPPPAPHRRALTAASTVLDRHSLPLRDRERRRRAARAPARATRASRSAWSAPSMKYSSRRALRAQRAPACRPCTTAPGDRPRARDAVSQSTPSAASRHSSNRSSAPGSCSIGRCGASPTGISTHLVQLQLPARLLRAHQVTDVRRVEHPSKDS